GTIRNGCVGSSMSGGAHRAPTPACAVAETAVRNGSARPSSDASVGHHAVAAGPLGRIEVLVGAPQQRRLGVAGPRLGGPDAHRHRDVAGQRAGIGRPAADFTPVTRPIDVYRT